MGDKVKPWHAKRPRRFGKKVSGLRTDDKRTVPLRADNDRVVPLHLGNFSEDDYYEDERWRR